MIYHIIKSNIYSRSAKECINISLSRQTTLWFVDSRNPLDFVDRSKSEGFTDRDKFL